MKTLLFVGLLCGHVSGQGAPPVARFADIEPRPAVGDFTKASTGELANAPEQPRPVTFAVAAFPQFDQQRDDADRALALLEGDPYREMLGAAEKRRSDASSAAYGDQLLFANPYSEELQFANPYTEEPRLANPYAEPVRSSTPYTEPAISSPYR